MIFTCIPLVILLWCLAGQINKLFRPIGVPLSIIAIYLLWHNHSIWYFIPTLLYGFELTLGYGDDSRLMKWLRNDESVRVVYSIMCCIPVIITCALTENWLSSISILGIIGAFQLRLGSLGKIGKYDFLSDDIFRGLSIGFGMSLALI